MKYTPFSLKLFKDVFNNENRLRKLFDEGKISEATFSTNAAESSVKSWVMARRNFLFSGSGNGARASCFIKGLLQTLKTAKSRL